MNERDLTRAHAARFRDMRKRDYERAVRKLGCSFDPNGTGMVFAPNGSRQMRPSGRTYRARLADIRHWLVSSPELAAVLAAESAL